jgi:hypothetical protein
MLGQSLVLAQRVEQIPVVSPMSTQKVEAQSSDF